MDKILQKRHLQINDVIYDVTVSGQIGLKFCGGGAGIFECFFNFD